MQINTISNISNLKGRRVLLRADLNVPVKRGQVKDEYKIHKSLPTIKFLTQKGAKVILVSHWGRPKRIDKKLGLGSVAKCVEKYLKKKVRILDIKNIKILKKYWELAGRAVAGMKGGQVLMLDNIRFFPDEEKNIGTLAKDLASLADIFVLDGFAVAHRAAASVSGAAKFLPAYAGLLLEEEVKGLSRVLESPRKPLVVALGGAKLETKIPVLKKLLPLADYILIGGGIGNTYLLSKGYKLGASLAEKEFKKEMWEYAKNKKVVMPVDVIVGTHDGKEYRAVDIKKLAISDKRHAIYDIGPRTVRLFAEYIKKAQTLVWNGAMGYFEQPPYHCGTYAIARLIASRSKGRAFGVCGGGETVEVLQKLDLMYDIDLVSTGGGAMLEFLSGKKLPGVEAVSKKTHRTLAVSKK